MTGGDRCNEAGAEQEAVVFENFGETFMIVTIILTIYTLAQPRTGI